MGGRHIINKALKAALFAVAASVAPAQSAADAHVADADTEADAKLTVRTTLGAVKGQRSSDGAALRWLGIPYAQPPVGELRWKAPTPHVLWADVLDAHSFGAACSQLGSVYGPPAEGKPWGAANVEVFGRPVGQEDCLTLNVWRPDNDARHLPVIVFVHGGSNVAGYSGDPAYEGTHLSATANAVIVTINYRLGLFGWFAHTALQDKDVYGSSGNFGTLDIIQALRFVKSNAAGFGGDPNNVTLAGQSAGAIDVYSVMASPLSADLFHKAMIFSGLISWSKLEAAHEFSQKLVTQLVIDDGLAPTPQAAGQYISGHEVHWAAQYLRSKSAAQLLVAQSHNPTLRSVPTCLGDGEVIPADLEDGFSRGQFRHVPTILGQTRDEGKLFTAAVLKVADARRFTLMLNTDPDGPPIAPLKDLISSYLLPSLGSGLYDAYAWLILAVAEHKANAGIEMISQFEPKVFAYRFDWSRGPEPWKTLYGAGHAIDLPFIFGNFSKNFFAMDFSTRNRPGREELSRIMMRSIGAFIRTGDPNVPELGRRWNAWNSRDNGRQKLIFDASDQQAGLSSN